MLDGTATSSEILRKLFTSILFNCYFFLIFTFAYTQLPNKQIRSWIRPQMALLLRVCSSKLRLQRCLEAAALRPLKFGSAAGIPLRHIFRINLLSGIWRRRGTSSGSDNDDRLFNDIFSSENVK